MAVEKIIKFLCSCYDIEYDYSPYIISLVDKLLNKDIKIPEMIQDSLNKYVDWNINAQYTANQLALRSYVEKHINCAEEWLISVEKQMGFDIK
jgi:hypothetical protein